MLRNQIITQNTKLLIEFNGKKNLINTVRNKCLICNDIIYVAM